MPRRTDIESICLIGSGPIVIGQACEFDYAGCQALKVLREDGFRTIVVNSNPATIMTDPGFADRTYLEPLDLEGVADVLERERPDALLPTMGGQTALNLAIAAGRGGRARDARRRADRRGPRRDQARRGPRALPRGRPQRRPARADLADRHLDRRARRRLAAGGRPAGVHARRPRRRLRLHARGARRARSSAGCGRARSARCSSRSRCAAGTSSSSRSCATSTTTSSIVCSIENLDPMGVHTGDSVTVAPQMTLSDEAYQELRDAAAAVIRAVGVETGGSNIQFARDRETGELRVIEMNPRVSRSSALASKATGYPIAKVAAKLAVGYTLDEIPNDLTKTTPASFEPTLDYVVVKFPRFAFEKFPGADRDARHADEVGRRGDGDRPHVPRGVLEGDALARARRGRGHAVGRPRRPARGDPPVVPATSSSGCATKGRRRGSASTAASTRAPARSRPSRTTTTRPSARPTSRRRSPTSRAS